VTHSVTFRPAAQADLLQIYQYIEQHGSAERAGAYIDRIEAACMALATFPRRGTLREDLAPGMRVVGFERRASIIFRVDDNVVRIFRVLYAGRDYPSEWQEEA
jgi:toxin ParE1/3/4